MSENKAPTIKEIAKKLKISVSTVSRALNDHSSIGWVTTQRVKKMALEIGYVPNQSAIFFKKGKTCTIGVILPNISEPFFSTAVSTIETIANNKDYIVILGQSLDDPDREKKVIDIMKRHRVDGILISSAKNTVNFDYLDEIKKAGIPLVYFDCAPKNQATHAVLSNLKTGILEAIDFLVSCGHERVALLNGPPTLAASVEREDGFKTALEAHQLECIATYIIHTDLTTADNIRAMEALLNVPHRPTAVIIFNDFVALDALQVLKKHNLKVNQDIFFISFANFPIWKHIENAPICCIEQMPDEQAMLATEKLFQLIENKDLAAEHITLNSKLIKR